MKISFIIPRWPKDSFWDVIAFKFPLLSTSLLAGLTPSHHQTRIMDESLTEIDFNQEVDLVAITAITPLAPRGYEIADEFRRRGKKVVIGGIHASWLPLCIQFAATTPLAHKCAIGCKNLNTVVAAIGDKKRAIFGDCQIAREVELSLP